MDRDIFETVSEFYSLDDAIGQAGGCIDAVTTRIQSTSKVFFMNFYLYSRAEVYHL